ncbi:MAG: sugar ABC transporter permease [Acetatifactor sp.]|jgi:ABC-type sugar transport system permease subunit|nr:sugar ABC transporter permease [Acetatifactor sp.]
MSARTAKRKKLKSFQRRQDKYGYLFMAPWIIGFIIFTFIPFVMTAYLSFTDVKQDIRGFNINFVGIKNYREAFLVNTEFTPALVAFLGMIIPYTLVIVIMAFILAMMLNAIVKGKSVFRTIYFLPVVVLSGPVMYQLMHLEPAVEGQINPLYYTFVIRMIYSYSEPLANAMVSLFDNLSIILWFTGIPIVLFINGLQKINPSLYEAARIDSATSWQILWKITMPIIRPTALIVTIFSIVQLGAMDNINPVLVQIKEKTANTSGGFGYAATLSWVYSLLVLVIIGIAFLVFRERKIKETHKYW